MPNKIIFLIVLYNKVVEESTTVITLLESDITNAKIIIHNNGPAEVLLSSHILNAFNEKHINVELVNCVQNKPLSILYNQFLSSNPDYDKYVLLDDDSVITREYVDQLHMSDYELLLPRISSVQDGTIYYPILNESVITGDKFLATKGLFSIGSGLILTSGFLDKFVKVNFKPFDEKFALYGVDFSLFRRMNILSEQGEFFKVKTAGEIIHSLSRTDGVESKFRREERLIHFSLTTRNYPSYYQCYIFLKRSIKEILFFRVRNLYVMYDAFLHGSHPRCR